VNDVIVFKHVHSVEIFKCNFANLFSCVPARFCLLIRIIIVVTKNTFLSLVIFEVNLDYPVPVFFATCSRIEPSGRSYMAPFYRMDILPNQQRQTTDLSQWPGLILHSSPDSLTESATGHCSLCAGCPNPVPIDIILGRCHDRLPN